MATDASWGRRVIGRYGDFASLSALSCMVTLSSCDWLKEDHKWPVPNSFNVGALSRYRLDLAKFAHGMAQYAAHWDFKNPLVSPTIKWPVARQS
jgi:hypothetical protein